jgi:hypothetical protein
MKEEFANESRAKYLLFVLGCIVGVALSSLVIYAIIHFLLKND